MDRRGFIFGSAAAAVTVKASFAQDAVYPTHAIVMINPFPPGGAADVVGRPLAAVMEPMVQKPVVIETKSGAAGAVGAQFVANAKPDGYTLLLHITSISGFAEVDNLFGRTPKFTRADFIPIARFVADPCVLIVNDQQPYKTLKELVNDAKKRPNEIVFSSSGRRRRRLEAQAFTDPGRRPGANRIPRRQFADAGVVDFGEPLPDQGGQGAAACFVRRATLQGAPRCADDEGVGLRHRILSLGRPVRAQGHTGGCHHLSARSSR
jgi:hypothetical protein